VTTWHVVCAWCGAWQSSEVREGSESEATSHTICAECLLARYAAQEGIGADVG